MAQPAKPKQRDATKAAAAASRARAQARSVSVANNRLTLLTDGPERLETLLAIIDGAQTSLRLMYYIYANDRSGALVREALMRAVGRGVKVSLLIDGFGSSKLPNTYFNRLTKAGATFCRFLPGISRRYLIRNHQKLALADDKVVLIGGFNVEDDYFEPKESGAWRDLGLLIEGPAAGRLSPYYDELVEWALRKRGKIRDLCAIIGRFSETSGPLQWSYGGPARKLSPWALATCRDLGESRDVAMIAAYFAPSFGMLRRMGRAGRRGRARIITAAKSDNNATIAAARFTYNRLIKRGVEIFEYQVTKLHSKLVVFDDVVHIGSSNFDIRSLYLNLEMMLRVEDEEFASLCRVYFEGEVQDSLAITPAIQKRRATWLRRIKWALSFFVVTAGDYTVTRRLNFGVE